MCIYRHKYAHICWTHTHTHTVGRSGQALCGSRHARLDSAYECACTSTAPGIYTLPPYPINYACMRTVSIHKQNMHPRIYAYLHI